MSNNYTRNSQEYWICLFIFMLAITARVIPGASTIDDSFITYRYARNILSGEGFVYNPGEYVLGMITPLDSAYYVINYAVPPDLILDYQPDYVTLLEVYGRAGLFKEPRFWQEYELLKKIETDIYGSDGMLIFRKK